MVPVATGGPALGHRSHRLPHRALALLPAWQVAEGKGVGRRANQKQRL